MVNVLFGPYLIRENKKNEIIQKSVKWMMVLIKADDLSDIHAQISIVHLPPSILIFAPDSKPLAAATDVGICMFVPGIVIVAFCDELFACCC